MLFLSGNAPTVGSKQNRPENKAEDGRLTHAQHSLLVGPRLGDKRVFMRGY